MTPAGAEPSVAELPGFTLAAHAPGTRGVDAVAIAVMDSDGELALGPGADQLGTELDVDLLALAEQARAAAGAGQVAALPLPGGTVFLVGVGDAGPDALRKAGAALARAAVGRDRISSAVQAVGDADGLTAFVAGAMLASFRFRIGAGDPAKAPVRRIELALAAPELDKPVLERAEAIARAGAEARRLATTPSNIKSPAWLAAESLRLAEPGRLKTKVWERAQLEKGGFGGILAVGQASATPPCLVQLDYTPRHKRRVPHVVLVGKGITFDTGGLSIKPGEAMVNMKRDMTGAAVVASAVGALHQVDCPVRVTGLLAIAENSIGGNALRPGDVITHYGGRTTEVTNTDAEGRLVLADALQYAVDELKPDLIVDIATLTGAMKVALGLHTGGYFATDEAAVAQLERAATASGERLWRMPLSEEYESFLSSKVADADNAPGRAPAITAALFLQHFTGGLPWVHLDIASVGDAAQEKDEWTAGPTGFGVRLLLHWLGSADPMEGIRR